MPESYDRVRDRWRDASTPTRAASEDEVSKYVGTGVLPATSQIVWDRMGLTPAEQAQLRTELRGAPPSDLAQLTQSIARRATTT